MVPLSPLPDDTFQSDAEPVAPAPAEEAAAPAEAPAEEGNYRAVVLKMVVLYK